MVTKNKNIKAIIVGYPAYRSMGSVLSTSSTTPSSGASSPSKRKEFKFFFDDDDDNTSSLPTTTVNTNQKLSKLSTIFGSIVIIAAAILFILNNWHATKCSSNKTSEEIAEYIESLKDRLLEAESQAIRNELILSGTLKELEKRLYNIESKKIQSLSGNTDRKVEPQCNELGLALGLQKSPFHASYDLDPKYHDRKVFEELIDEVFSKYEDIKSISHVTSAQTDVEFSAISSESASSNEMSSSKSNLSISELSELCNKWVIEYAVIKGHSWGFLPYDLQQKYVEYDCDKLTDLPPDAV